MKFKMKTFVKWIIKNWEILKHKKIYKINLDCIEKKNKKKTWNLHSITHENVNSEQLDNTILWEI